jgi:hypothetical protein
MQATRSILRRPQLFRALQVQVVRPAALSQQLISRHFASAAAPAPSTAPSACHDNFVREGIKKMILERDHDDDIKKSIDDDELERRFQSLNVSTDCFLVLFERRPKRFCLLGHFTDSDLSAVCLAHIQPSMMQNLYEEARLCIADCREAVGEQFDEERNSAKTAVDNAFGAFVEILEDLRHAREDQLLRYNDARLQNANNLKMLRKELVSIQQQNR